MSFEVVTIGPARLYRADCRDVLPTLGEGAADHCITDPPYGIGKASWDDFFPRDWLHPVKLVVRPSGVIAILTNAGDALRDAINLLGPLYRTTFAAWLCNGMTRGPISFGNWIPITVGSAEPEWRSVQDVIRVRIQPSEAVPEHPSPKPPELMVQVVERLTNTGETVVDPFSGSGTTGVACLRLGRSFIGIEKDPAHFATACRRITEAWHADKSSLFPAFGDPR